MREIKFTHPLTPFPGVSGVGRCGRRCKRHFLSSLVGTLKNVARYVLDFCSFFFYRTFRAARPSDTPRFCFLLVTLPTSAHRRRQFQVQHNGRIPGADDT